ncbi:ABC transporter substrate-binding protein [Thermocatellispora tengchongensis]
MRNKPRTVTRAAAAAALLALAVASCASEKATGGPAATGGDGVKTGPGVTADKITVAMMTDLTGPYASLGKSITQAQQLYFEQLNHAGGVCGRTVETVVRDHGYDAQKAVAAYTELAPKSAVVAHFIGSPMVLALKQRIEADKLLTIPMAWATGLLGARAIQVTATTYDVDMINGVDFLVKEKGIKKGDTIGHLYFEGDYGESALDGSKYAAEKLGLKIFEQKIKATDQDMSAQVAAFKSAGVKAILISAGPRQAASLVGVAVSKGMDVPFVGSNSAYAPQLLATPAAPALLKDYYIMTGGALDERQGARDREAGRRLQGQVPQRRHRQRCVGGVLRGPDRRRRAEEGVRGQGPQPRGHHHRPPRPEGVERGLRLDAGLLGVRPAGVAGVVHRQAGQGGPGRLGDLQGAGGLRPGQGLPGPRRVICGE